ncbi:hypothetical protein D8674_004497 [Pyrus ussuriensis x Pyrus communis]|uniref:Pectinesterase inhibitor domain-containing protein n=1 Tax=Pyrus ussuriensis x Pyrus communis TaxID=2448454 RepID=A0A5N5FQG9_9ROSA|nr:hypothetical protein D8674_004497 [Pyrus ussuriensis x Pyrus communis]URX64863.1 pectin methylesterase inhibitor [Pyrus x bretschneideri]
MESPLGYALTLFFAGHLFFFLSSPSPANASAQLVDVVCQKSINNTQCMEVLHSDPRVKSASTYILLAQVALDLAIGNAKDSQAFINNLLKSDPTEPIKQCASSYELVVASFQSAKVEIHEDPLTANYDVKIAGDDAGNCETALRSKGVKYPELSARNHVVLLYSSIGDVITGQID